MLANLIIRYKSQESNLQVKKLRIFPNCLICNKERVISSIENVKIGEQIKHIYNVSCGCTHSNPHADLVAEASIIKMLKKMKIHRAIR